MLRFPKSNSAIQPAQLSRLQALWHLWTHPLGLAPDADRKLRHYYVELFSQGAARETLDLDRLRAGRVIAWLERLTSRSRNALRRAAGTAGRHGFPERRNLNPDRAAWRAFWAVAHALGMSRAGVDRFISAHYSSKGLHALDDIQSMADLNRVLWGLKSILRRRPKTARVACKKAA